MKELRFIDAGNSQVKIARFDQISGWNVQALDYEALSLFNNPPASVEYFGVSVVPHREKAIESTLQAPVKWLKRSDLPETWIHYETPQTLGLDRVIAARGAWSAEPGRSVLLIDSGSAIKLDLVDKAGVFKGGIIAPGLSALEIGLNAKAPLLPSVDRSIPEYFPGNSTKSCIQWGISGGLLMMIEGFIRRYFNEFAIEKIVLTGGDAKFIYENISTDIQVSLNLNAIFDGLLHFSNKEV